MDKTDIAILTLLQRDASLSVAEIAEAVHLSRGPCWRRIRALEVGGYIQRRVALLDPEKLNVGTTVFVHLKTNRHDAAWFDAFNAAIGAIPEVVEFHRLSGDVDYLLRLVIPDIAAYDAVYKQLIRVGGLTDVSASFALERIKSTTELPLAYIRS
ncbi:MAG: Lrp/AsnC family transcriptional regulator [Gammaproteobacteria bacterium PRO9]|nr:Lrp/AsnC family transcriptional regulator [Gammaproteobacteria bacterium PRO9]